MALRINHNQESLAAQRSLAKADQALSGNFRRLATGLRIADAADDAAGLALSERLRAQIRSLDQARRNASDGISLVQTAEGSLAEANTILVRLRELTVQAANGTVSDQDKATLNAEFQSLVSELDRIGRSTSFNGIHLLDGSASQVSFQVDLGTTPGVDTIAVALSPTLSTSLGIDALNIGSAGNTSAALTNLDAAIDAISSLRGRLGAAQNRLDSTISNLSSRGENLSAAESRIRDVDVAWESALLAKNKILRQASISILTQANTLPNSALSLIGVDF